MEEDTDHGLAVEIAMVLMRKFEGLVLHPYLCSSGVPSIGYGATRYLDGRAVQLTDPPISKEAAERMLLVMVKRDYRPFVLRLCPGIDRTTRLAAIIDFAYNLGVGNLKGSTLRKRINQGDWSRVPSELRKWNLSRGRVMRGLVLRREAEASLI